MNEVPVFKFSLIQPTTSLVVTETFLPTKGSEMATGWDVRSAANLRLRGGQYAKIPLGFRVFAPEGWWLELRPRSSTFAKKKLHSLYGVIDEDYEGQCLFACQYIPDVSTLGRDLTIEFGDAIGQIIPVRRQEMKVEVVDEEEFKKLTEQRQFSRGAGGFGSTDTRK